jgi:streptogramin lyase
MKLRALIAIATVMLGGCGGASDRPTIVPTTNPTSTPAGASNVTFSVVVPNPATSAAASRPAYVSSATQSITVTLNGKEIATGNVSVTSPSCSSGSSARTCNIAASAPQGSDVFTITAYDQPNGSGNILSSGTLSASVGSSPQTLPVTMMSGSAAKIALVIANPYPAAGSATTTNVSVEAFDIDGSTIIGSYSQPVTVTDQDTSGITTLSGSPITSSSGAQTLSYSGAPFHATTLTATTGTLEATAIFAPEPTVTATFTTPPQAPPSIEQYNLWAIIAGPGGKIWAAGQTEAVIASFTANGLGPVYQIPDPFAFPQGIANGPDGRIWIAQNGDGIIGAMTTTGVFSQYTVPAGTQVSQPEFITEGPDGNMYATDAGLAAVLQITPSGAITVFPEPNSGTARPLGIVTGPDGNLWIADELQNAILVMSTSGQFIAEYPLAPGSAPFRITVGPDSNLWFTEWGSSKIGRMTTHGLLTEFATPTAFSQPLGITTGPDGNLWFTEPGGAPNVGTPRFGYITPDGSTIKDYAYEPQGAPPEHLIDLVFGANGELWVDGYYCSLGFCNPSAVSTIVY